MPDKSTVVLPTGYEINPTEHGDSVHIFKNGKPLRQAQQVPNLGGTRHFCMPIRFKIADYMQAIAYACRHAELQLDASQQVPDWQYYAEN